MVKYAYQPERLRTELITMRLRRDDAELLRFLAAQRHTRPGTICRDAVESMLADMRSETAADEQGVSD